MANFKYSKDPKISLKTLEEFFYANDYLRGITKKKHLE